MMMRDITGREFDDPLTTFLQWWMKQPIIVMPLSRPLTFYDGAVGVTLFRRVQYQVQLWTVPPNYFIPEHVHPVVDSYEVFLHGMEFILDGEEVTKGFDVMTARQMQLVWESPIPELHAAVIRVKPDALHGGTSRDGGGAFLSVQEWQYGHLPTSVADDWEGAMLGPEHEKFLGEAI